MATDPGWPDFATLVARTAETPVASTVHEPFGSPSGPGLFHVKGLQLPAYVQHVAHHLVAQGHPESKAIQIAIGVIKNWAAGHDGHGNKVHADVQAAAAKAVAEWEAAKAAAHGKRFNPYHAPAGVGGGEFTSAGGAGKGGGKAAGKAASSGHAAQAAAAKPAAHGSKQQLLARAHADREKARKLEAELHGLVKQEQAHTAAAAKAKAQVAKLKKAGHHSIANQHHVTHHHHAARARSLKDRIAGLRKQIHDLREQADRLESQAKGMRSFTPAGDVGGITVDYRAKAPYGDVPYGDPGYLDADGNQASKSGKPGVKRYPLTADKVRAAWSYINQAKNAGQYTSEQLSAIKGRIRSAMKQHGHEVSDSDSGRAMTAWGDTERRYTPGAIEVRSAADGPRIGGYGAVFGKLSRNLGGFVERVGDGAFNQARTLGWPNVVCRYNHSSDMVLGTTAGRTLQLRTDNIGLDYEVLPPSARADIVELVQRGDVQFSSFAFRVPAGGDEWSTTDQNYPLRTLHEVQLVDVAPVLDPAYPDATAGLRSLAAAMDAPFEDVAGLAAADELRRFFVRTDRPSFTPPKPKITGAAAMMRLMEKKFPELSQ